MSYQIIIAQLSILSVLVYSLYQFISLQKITVKKDKITLISSLIYDGLITFGKRAFSSTHQAILYTTLVFLLLSQIFSKPFYWDQVLAFFAGSLLISLATYTCIRIIPKLIIEVCSERSTLLTQILTWYYKASSCFSLFITGLSLMGFIICSIYLGKLSTIGYCFGILFASYYLRIGGGLFKSGTHIASNISSQMDNSVPEQDPRNPTTILDIVGDYIGKIMGFSSDILSSFMISLMACLLFPTFLAQRKFISLTMAETLESFTFLIIGISLITVLISVIFSRIRINSSHTDNFLLESLYLAIICGGISVFFFFKTSSISIPNHPIWGASTFSPFLAYLAGLLGAVAIGFCSEFLSSKRYSPAKKTAEETQYGTSLSLFNAFKTGLRGNSIYLVLIFLISLISFYSAGFLGIMFAALGMLSLTPTLLTLNVFSSLSSATLKAHELTDEINHTRKQLIRSDYVGNTTEAIGNGFSSAVAVLSSFGLFFALFFTKSTPLTILNLNKPWIIGLILGLMLPNLFSSTLLDKLQKLIHFTLEETFRQLKEIPFLKENKAKPDIIKAADENARFCFDSLIIPAIIMAFPPIIIGYLFLPEILLGLILGSILSILNLSFYWANLGDNTRSAKHYIQEGFIGGPQSKNYPNILTVNNVGNVFKDVLSPSINIFIKLTVILGLLSLVFQII